MGIFYVLLFTPEQKTSVLSRDKVNSIFYLDTWRNKTACGQRRKQHLSAQSIEQLLERNIYIYIWLYESALLTKILKNITYIKLFTGPIPSLFLKIMDSKSLLKLFYNSFHPNAPWMEYFWLMVNVGKYFICGSYGFTKARQCTMVTLPSLTPAKASKSSAADFLGDFQTPCSQSCRCFWNVTMRPKMAMETVHFQ